MQQKYGLCSNTMAEPPRTVWSNQVATMMSTVAEAAEEVVVVGAAR